MFQLAENMGPAESTAGLYVRFSKVPKQHAKKSDEQGRPVFEEVDYITIAVPGDKSSEVCRPVTPDDIARFKPAWDRYLAGQGERLDGIPLREWPGVTRAQVEELAYFNVRTVEQLAEVNDGNLKNMGPMLALRQKARDYLERVRSDAPAQRMRQELEQRDSQISKLQAQVEALLKRQDGGSEEAPRKRKHKPIAEVEYTPDIRPLGDSEAMG